MATDEVMSMIRIRAAGVMAVAVLVMTACGGSDDTATDTTAPAADEQSFAGGDTVEICTSRGARESVNYGDPMRQRWAAHGNR